MQIITIGVEQLQTIIADTVKAAIQETAADKPEPFDHYPESLTRRQAAEILNVCLSKIDQLSRDGYLKKYRNGSLVRLHKSDVVNFLQTFDKHQRN